MNNSREYKNIKNDGQSTHTHFKRCLQCKCEKLLKFDDDYFCDKCDWNSILYDVYSGNFERRIGMLSRMRRENNKIRDLECGVLLLEEIEGSDSELNHVTDYGVIYEPESENDLNSDDFNGGAA
jgi:hypothetical protein